MREVVEPVRRYLARRIDEATADDVLGETLLVLWRRLDDIPDGDAIPWAIGVARRQLTNAQRSARRQARLFARVATVDPPQAIPDHAASDTGYIRDAIARLRPVDAEVVRLWAWEDFDLEQIAGVLGITVNAATIRLHRARKRLRDEIGKSTGTAGPYSGEGRRNRMNSDDLERTLRRADPAASLPPLGPERFDRLMKDTTMTETVRRPATRTRTRIAVAVIGGLAAAGVAAVAFSSLNSAPTVLDASVPVAAKCAAPVVEYYADVDLAFAATVTSIEGDSVTLHVTDRFTGDVNDTVVTTQGDGAISDGGPLVYENGGDYLIASQDGTVLSCGLSGVASDELASIYAAAF